MKVLITGATGLVGSRLIKTLFEQGHTDVRILTRDKKKALEDSQFPIEIFEWDIKKGTMDQEALKDVHTVIHLAGESVAKGRWTDQKKMRILESRTKGTNLLIDTIRTSGYVPKKLISASAIGIYGDRDNENLNADSTHGDSFLAEVCKKWEAPIINHGIENLEAHIIRVGIVLSTEGGALEQMLPPFKFGVAGKLGSGKQYMSWVHIDDLVGQFIFLMTQKGHSQIYNGVSPKPVNNMEFTKTLGKVLKRPTIFPVPAFGLKILFGEMSEILLASQKVLPENFLKEGYQYKYTNLEDALNDLLKYENVDEDVLEKYQWTENSIDHVFKFFSDEKNLEKLTPSYLNFKVLKKNTDQIETGTLIDYKLRLHGIPLKWKSKISLFKKNDQFIDEQIKGPYSKWVHTHDFIPVKNGTLIRDHVVYKVPMGFIGRVLGGFFVKKDLNNIFNFRKKTIKQLLS